ncbi:hypothetical protein ACH5RR_038679 [Cinchona calisaya]|uniref:Uncharacterized protein n=1 Tax=Cinchona calisaya TaxID=153742 RepID=A0ABD2XYI0_9GENT
MKCFFCDGPHMARECPAKAKLAALAMEEEKAEEKQLGALRILNTIKVKKAQKKRGLMFADVEIAGHKLSALVDTGATDFFISIEVAKKLNLQVGKGMGTLKTVNTKEVPVHGLASNVDVAIGQWKGKTSLEVISLDDYDVVIGLDFLDRISAILLPFADCLYILDSQYQCVVPLKRESGRNHKTLSAIQLCSGVKRGDPTFLATLKLDEGDNQREPEVVAAVLGEYKSVMPTELPKELPPKRIVDHEIELIPGTKPLAMVPYCMAPPELTELRKQVGWQDFLAKFDYVLEYKLGRVNSVADALSRKTMLAAISQLESLLADRIKEGLKPDAAARSLLGYAKEGKTQGYEGPRQVGKVACKVDLPSKLKLHLMFHGSLFKLYHGDHEEPNCGLSRRAPTGAKTSYDHEGDCILKVREVRKRYCKPRIKYKVRWKARIGGSRSKPLGSSRSRLTHSIPPKPTRTLPE